MGLGMALAAPAWAHDTLVGSTPEDGEALDESPEEIVLEFSGDGLTEGDEITNEIRVLDEDGEDRAGQTEVEGSSMSASVEEGLPEGGYEIVYRVVYSDGHSEEQSLTFEVEEAGDEDGPTAEDAEEGTAEDDDAASEDEVAGGAEGDAASEDGTAEETDPAVEEGTVPAWALWGSAAAVVVVAVLVAVTVRRKLKE